MTRYLTKPNPYHPQYRRDMGAADIIAAVFPNNDYGTRVPADRSGETHIDGVYVCYLTTEAAKAQTKGPRGMYMRARAICPECMREFAASRLNQHARIHAK